MDFNQFHFAHPLALSLLLVIPFIILLFFLFYRYAQPHHQLTKFIDAHLLPYLLIDHSKQKSSNWKNLLAWSLVWACLTLALAGPRWNFREMETFSSDQSLVILLDLSESMNAPDIKPSRLTRAKQKIEDLLNASEGVKIGIIAFAADAHLITPITEDKETIRHLLPSLNTDLVYIQGSRLSPALEMAESMLKAEPGTNKALLVISDGGFEDSSALMLAQKLAQQGIAIHVMGIGTTEGAPIQEAKQKKKATFSKLEKNKLNELSQTGRGYYLDGSHSDRAETLILNDLKKQAEAKLKGRKDKFWDESFYLFLLPIIPFLLAWFKRGYIFPIIVIFSCMNFQLDALDFNTYFKNSEERGQQALEEGNYEAAAQAFQDPYRKGVAYYKANDFAQAEEMFKLSTRPELSCPSFFNLGNALAKQQKFKEAIQAYETTLKECPSHTKAKENLEIIKKIIEQQEKQKDSSDSKNDNSKQDKDQEKSDSQKDNKDKQDKSDGKDERSDQDKNQEPSNQKNEDNKKENETNSDTSKEKNNELKNPDESSKENENKQEQNKTDESKEQTDEKKEPHSASTEEDKESNDPQTEVEKQAQEQPQSDPSKKIKKSQEDLDADLWLNRLNQDPKVFLKNKFYIESKKKGTQEGINPW